MTETDWTKTKEVFLTKVKLSDVEVFQVGSPAVDSLLHKMFDWAFELGWEAREKMGFVPRGEMFLEGDEASTER